MEDNNKLLTVEDACNVIKNKRKNDSLLIQYGEEKYESFYLPKTQDGTSSANVIVSFPKRYKYPPIVFCPDLKFGDSDDYFVAGSSTYKKVYAEASSITNSSVDLRWSIRRIAYTSSMSTKGNMYVRWIAIGIPEDD